ncbi:MAG: FAD:protein FMN transferase, partial [Bradymonadaceae bacterium]
VSAAAAPGKVARGERILMGTHFEIQIASLDIVGARHAIDAAFDEVARVEALLSEWRPESEISKVNRSAADGPVSVGPELLEVVQRSVEFAKLTDGAFDITFASCKGLWSFRTPRIPDDAELAKCLQHVDSDKLIIDERASTIRFASSGMQIGIAAIGKGYGVDRAAAILEARGFNDFFVDGGGEIRVSGARFERPWSVGIADPRKPGTLLRTLPVSEGAVATSGDYEQYFEKDGVRYHHILDPRTGKPAPASVAVTVLATTTIEADALATGLFVMGPKAGLELVEKLPGVEAFFIDPDLVVHTSTNWK